MKSMTKCIPVHKNMTGNCEQDAEEESSASEGKRETVGKPTGKTPDTQDVRNVTETVTEKRMMEETPPSAREQVPRHLSTERCEVTGESSSHTERVQQQEVTNESPTDHASDQDNDEDNSSEVNRKDDQVEFIRELPSDSHAVAIQWVHMVKDPPATILLVHTVAINNDRYLITWP